ncbi:MAG: hypothetical protein KA100_05465 [Rickettsiales bacterium]|nr:hypothetical protein [Rickettsiales bacterium]
MKKEITSRDLKIFGLIWAAIFAFVSFKSESLKVVAAVAATVFTCVSLIDPQIYLRTKIYQSWIKIGDFLGKVNGFLISAILFYVIFTPVAIVLRLLKKDLLNKKLNPSQSSYFIDRKEQPTSMKNQF